MDRIAMLADLERDARRLRSAWAGAEMRLAELPFDPARRAMRNARARELAETERLIAVLSGAHTLLEAA